MTINRYNVTVHRNDPDRVEHEQDFFVADFPDAKDRAERHAEHMRRLWPEPEYSTYVTECVTPP